MVRERGRGGKKRLVVRGGLRVCMREKDNGGCNYVGREIKCMVEDIRR